MFFGSETKGTIYRAAPGAARAEAWIQPGTTGLMYTLGVFADDRANTLWVCSSATGGRRGAPVVGTTTLRSYDLRTAAVKGVYPFPGGRLASATTSRWRPMIRRTRPIRPAGVFCA